MEEGEVKLIGEILVTGDIIGGGGGLIIDAMFDADSWGFMLSDNGVFGSSALVDCSLLLLYFVVLGVFGSTPLCLLNVRLVIKIIQNYLFTDTLELKLRAFKNPIT